MKQLRTLAVAAALAGAILGPASTARAETIRDGVMGFSIAFPGDADREELEEDLPDWVHRVTAWEQHDERGTGPERREDRHVPASGVFGGCAAGYPVRR